MQKFNYLMVLDFEATCWDTHRGRSEVIEFPVVFYDVHKRKVVDEFRHYVMPEECPKLSEYCRQLTGKWILFASLYCKEFVLVAKNHLFLLFLFWGITQEQVESGVPLRTCLMLFMDWLKELRAKYKFYFPNEREYKRSKKCIFVTWTDWDLGVCLRNECRRKKLSKPGIFSCWIDLQLLYKVWKCLFIWNINVTA